MDYEKGTGLDVPRLILCCSMQWVSDQLSMGTGLHDDEGHDQQEGQSGDSQSSMAIEPEVRGTDSPF